MSRSCRMARSGLQISEQPDRVASGLRGTMRIRVGCEMTYQFGQATPMIVMLNVHASRVSDLEQPDYVLTRPSVPLEGYRDSYGNWCNRLVAPPGQFGLSTETVVRDSGQPYPAYVAAEQHP